MGGLCLLHAQSGVGISRRIAPHDGFGRPPVPAAALGPGADPAFKPAEGNIGNRDRRAPDASKVGQAPKDRNLLKMRLYQPRDKHQYQRMEQVTAVGNTADQGQGWRTEQLRAPAMEQDVHNRTGRD